AYGPLLLSPARLVVLALFAEAAVTSLTAVMVLQHMGLIDACAQVPSCAAKLAEAAGLFSLLTVLPLQQPLWGIAIAVFPEVMFAIAFAGAVEIILAIEVCVESGECKEKKAKNCIQWEEENPGGPYSGMGRGMGRPKLEFDQRQKDKIKEENFKRNNGVL